ncbi:MAG: hypothetical protein A2649_04145 [Candidatus Yanofskybacteria bacterium RIFCSPHIGHO2_01_FULL_41_26]|uniref:Uncharacterized protein n=1 Tax=Candidatus Yanofskybacteria bacterium RIFCSPHIGHO2_01_FULL_41_26 TaxID=1802661 RepID=A0A1F8EEH4_9BACT|nr:MAG: hypothetical protein A2649_04145 [Candidatus Yanofskybacteria bacterium RIFCSPHIGHO2_01_FULL_41_26]
MGAGRLYRIIVGTHLLVSTPAFAKAMAGKPSEGHLELADNHNFPAKDWLGIIIRISDGFLRVHPVFLRTHCWVRPQRV